MCRRAVAAILIVAFFGIGQLRADPPSVRISFDGDVKPFLTKHCIKCHGEKKQKGKLAFHRLDPVKLGDSDSALWTKMVEALEFGEMPPEDQPRPPKHQLKRVAILSRLMPLLRMTFLYRRCSLIKFSQCLSKGVGYGDSY